MKVLSEGRECTKQEVQFINSVSQHGHNLKSTLHIYFRCNTLYMHN